MLAIVYFPSRRAESFSFSSQMNSSSSVSTCRMNSAKIDHGFVYILRSSMTISMSMWPKSRRRKRSVMRQRVAGRVAGLIEPRLAVEAGGFVDERVALPAADREAVPRRPVDTSGSGRPSVRIWRNVVRDS